MTPFNCFIASTIPRRRPRIFRPQTTDLTADAPSRGALRALAAYPCLSLACCINFEAIYAGQVPSHNPCVACHI